MGPDLRRPSLTCGRALAVAGALVVLLAAPAMADDPGPSPGSAQVSTLAPPSQQQIDDARSALQRLRAPAHAPKTVLARASAPVAPSARESVIARISDQVWWTIGAALLVLLVLSDSTRLRVRKGKHRKT